MFAKRTDLALEARELWKESAPKTTKLSGVKARTVRREGCAVTKVDILDAEGARALGKSEGSYITVDLGELRRQPGEFFPRAVRAVGGELRELLPKDGCILVAGLGNPAMTADAVGSLTLKNLLVTRHLIASMPKEFSGFRSVAACAADVLGNTGVESAEAVRAMVAEVQPAAVIAVDALASRRTERLCATVQLSDTGIAPGSGVGNHRAALTEETLGVPVIAVGVPTVADSATLAADLLEKSGVTDFDADALRRERDGLLVTTHDIDARVRELSRVVGFGINWALQELDIEEMSALLG